MTVAPTPTPTSTTAPTPTPTRTPRPRPTPTPTPEGEVKGESKKKCVSRRTLKIKLRRYIAIGPWESAKFWVNGKRIKTRIVAGRLGALIDMRGMPKRKVYVRIRAVAQTGKVYRGRRVYLTCTPKKPHTTPGPLRSAPLL